MSKITKLQAAIAKEKMTKLQRLEIELKKEKAKELYLVYRSPGALVSEESSRKVKNKDIKAAVKNAKSFSPYGFCYENGNGKQIGSFYYITGTLLRYEEIPRTDENHILRSNMFCNEWPVVVENRNSYRITRPFGENDVIIDWDGNIVAKGNSKELMAYRKQFLNLKNKGKMKHA